MLQNVTLGLRGLQMILAIAIIGLSASLVAEKICLPTEYHCRYAMSLLDKYQRAARTLYYCFFLGSYGIVIAALGMASLFTDRIPLIVPLVGDSIGAMLYLAGGIAWAVHLTDFHGRCSALRQVDRQIDVRFVDDLVGTCRRCEADHGLVWAMFAFTVGLIICDFFRRRYQRQSSN